MDIPECSPAKVQELYEQDGGTVLIDVREPSEVQEVSVPWARNFPLSEFDPETVLNELNLQGGTQGTTIYVLCRSGRRSLQAAEKLRDYGYSDTCNVTGGIIDWQKLGLPTGSGNAAQE